MRARAQVQRRDRVDVGLLLCSVMKRLLRNTKGGMARVLRNPVDLFDIHPMAGRIGAEVHGVDVLALDDHEITALRRLWLDNLIVVFVGQQHVDQEGLARFASRFGRSIGIR